MAKYNWTKNGNKIELYFSNFVFIITGHTVTNVKNNLTSEGHKLQCYMNNKYYKAGNPETYGTAGFFETESEAKEAAEKYVKSCGV